MSATCAFSAGFDSGFEICVPVTVTQPIRRVIVRTEPAIRPLRLSGETVGQPFTEPGRIIVNPLVGAETYAIAYTDTAAVMLRYTAPASARMDAVLAGYAIDQGEFSAGMVLVDEDVEALILAGVI